MKVVFTRYPRSIWPGTILVLALAYLFQAAPHGHVGILHPEPHPTQQEPADHAHASADHVHVPADNDDERGAAKNQHHHHAVAQHLDIHSVRPSLAAVDRDHGVPLALVVAVAPIPASRPCGFVAAGPAEPVPDDPLRLHALSRAPPA